MPGTNAAGNALSTGFSLGKIQKIMGYVYHTGILIHYNHPAGPHHRPCLSETLIIHRQIQQLFRDASPGRSAGLDCLKCLTLWYATPYLVNKLPQGNAHRYFHKPGVVYLSHEGKYLSTLTPVCPYSRVIFSAPIDNERYICPGLYIVYICGPTPQPLLGRIWRSGPGFTFSPFNRCHQGRLLATDKSPCTPGNLEVKTKRRAK